MLFLFFSFLILIISCECCHKSGGGGCCHKKIPPVQMNNCGGGCQQGYGCGQYGCAKRKAFGGLTKRIDGILIDIETDEEAELYDASEALQAEKINKSISLDHLTNPNFIFHSCCESRGLPDSCLRHCHFNAYTRSSLESMFYKTDNCPLEALNEIHYCAAQGIDHRKCCSTIGVENTSAGRKCLVFCDQRPNKFSPIDSSYLPCLNVFEEIKQCFYGEIKQRAEKKFLKNHEEVV